MNAFELKPLLFAGLIGAGLLYLFQQVLNPTPVSSCSPCSAGSASASAVTLGIGFAVGAGVQIGVRLLGVS